MKVIIFKLSVERTEILMRNSGKIYLAAALRPIGIIQTVKSVLRLVKKYVGQARGGWI